MAELTDSQEQERLDAKYRYHSAAIYIEQGKHNEKFWTHPSEATTLPAYLLAHNKYFYYAHWSASVALLALALFETPASFNIGLDPENGMSYVTGAAELILLFIISLDVWVRSVWLGFWKCYRQNARKTFTITILFGMILEVCVVLFRGKTHMRITRCLRPVFAIDDHFSDNIRRFLRQITQSLSPVMDMLLLLGMFMALYSTLGYYFFQSIDPVNFGLPSTAFISLFVLLTTANHPDVMMKAYDAHGWYCLFFISYLCIELYFLMNLLLAVVYDAFTSNEKEKFRRLFLHRREGTHRAFAWLAAADKDADELGLSLRPLAETMYYLRPDFGITERYLTFKVLTTAASKDRLKLGDFEKIYDVLSLHWKAFDFNADTSGDQSITQFTKRTLYTIKRIVDHTYFSTFFYGVSFLCGSWYLVVTFIHEYDMALSDATDKCYFIISALFTISFTIELLMRILAYRREFPRSYWNIFDLIVTVTAVIGLVFYRNHWGLSNVIILKSLNLIRLLEYKRRYRDIFSTVSILGPRFASAAMSLLLINYCFAIVAIELMGKVDLKNCCKNSTVTASYTTEGRYYLNNFETLLSSYVTLWDLMVINNWFIIMEGYAIAFSQKSRLFFMIYYIVMMVVLTIVVTFVLEGFVFRIKCGREAEERDESRGEINVDTGSYCCRTYLSEMEVQKLTSLDQAIKTQSKRLTTREWSELSEMCETQWDFGSIPFEGSRKKDRFDFSTELYQEDVELWRQQPYETFYENSG